MRPFLILALLLSAAPAGAQEANPEKSAKSPWPVDPRCAVMAAHAYNQGALTGACLPVEAARPYLVQPPSEIRAQEQQQNSTIERRRSPQPPPRPQD